MTSGRVRAGILVLVLACCAYGLYLDWPGTLAALHHLRWYSMALSLLAAMGGAWCLMLAWRSVLRDLGSRLDIAPAARACFVGQLGKYVPGAVWSMAAQMELCHDHGVPRRRGITSIVVSLAITTGTGLAIAAATLPLASPEVLRRYWWVLIAVPLILLGLCPPVLGLVLDRALVLVRQQPLEQRPSWRGMLSACGWNTAGWLLLGAQAWVLLAGLTGRGYHVALVAIGGYALAYSAGLLLVVLPSGIGAREVILVAAITSVAPHSVAVAVALAARLVTTVSDLACGALGLAAGRSRSSRVAAAAPPGPAAGPGPAVAPVPVVVQGQLNFGAGDPREPRHIG